MEIKEIVENEYARKALIGCEIVNVIINTTNVELILARSGVTISIAVPHKYEVGNTRRRL